MDKIYVNGMEFYGYHGVFPEETRLGQRFAVDLAVSVDLKKAGDTDELEHSVNYGELYEVCKEVVEGKPYKLVEAVAERIAGSVLAGFPLVSEVTVKVIKPDPPIPGHYKSVAVEITRRR
ncbi:dihydroneopterin aldolase [Neobacillus vireti]|uniref:7,8-dihydroneopterin aldolase n=1 Tax=Neobacillus vireti LMG 21834 TaxID=1131730 RepID=A0AB94IRM0_9BACI|nr:dihydroneopterin aldolase [Neobacillus vireti]ETI69715.1 dihydroneopterin aldolase [Neobacillus vireti LMG 21834]KLT15411.1 dihydroneopterin aldolase [Neobacillus vireti]